MRTDAHAASYESEAGRDMSDGDNATPGVPAPGRPDSDGANQWLTRISAAIARRRAVGAQRHSDEPEADDDTSSQTGSHTDGVTVADLIAKVHGAAQRSPEQLQRQPSPRHRQPRRPRPVATARPAAPPPRQRHRGSFGPRRRDQRSTDPDTEIIPVVAYADEIPDLAASRRARRERVAARRASGERSTAKPETAQAEVAAHETMSPAVPPPP